MSKTKKSKRQSSESEASSSSDESSNSSDQSSSSSEKVMKNKNSKKSKTKHRRKSNSDNESSPNSKKKKHEKHDKKLFKNNRQNKEFLPGDAEHKKHSKHSENREDNREADHNWTAAAEHHERSRWDSPSREVADNDYDRRRGYSNYNRNQNNYRHNDRGRNRNNYRRDDRYQDRRDWRDDNKNRFDRNEQTNRNRGDRRSPERKERREDDSRNRRSQERRSDNRQKERHDKDRAKRMSRSESPQRPRKFSRKTDEDNKTYEWGRREDNEKEEERTTPVEKEKPNFGLSGKLTEDTNKVNGVVIKYAEPPEARKPKRRWRLYPFKGEKALPTLYIHRQSCYLIGRDRKVCDLPVDHPSCSKQHAALQYRLVPFEREDGTVGKRVRPYLIDLESANGTFINNKPIEPRKYVELLEKDVIKFGFSSREYVLLHENSKEEEQDDDVFTEEVQVKEEPED